MRLLERRRAPDRPTFDTRVIRESEHRPGELPSFARPLGLDVILTEQGRAVLIEVQHGFGRRGLIELFPDENRLYRRTYWKLRRERGRSSVLLHGLQRIAGDKTQTYRLLARYQPASLIYRGWSREVESWLAVLPGQTVLCKPPRGSCGEGILVLGREELALTRGAALGSDVWLLQAFVRSKLLPGPDAASHVGCIRHIVLLDSDGARLSFLHLPSYWRVSPEPFDPSGGKDALTANISRGAFALPLDEGEEQVVLGLTEEVLAEMVRHIFGLPWIERGSSVWLHQGA